MIVKFLFILLTSGVVNQGNCVSFDKEKIRKYREKVKNMFYHAYNGYLTYAYPYDELMPLTCSGMDTWGSFSLTLVDALDTLIIVGNYSEFERASKLVLDNVNVNANVNVSVFETNIRVIGGLLSAHMLSGLAGIQLDDGWPCDGPLLRLAERMANKLLPAFNSRTGMPYGTVNLKYGLHKQETPVTCTAGVGTFLIEFISLSRLAGNPVFERVAEKAMQQLWAHRSGIGLLGNHINVETGTWTATDAGIGAGVDSYFEYLVKAAVLFDKPEWMRQFKEHRKAIEKYIEKSDWFLWVSMTQGHVTLPVFQSLEAFWPGVLTLVGDVDKASRILFNYYQIVKQYGFVPEFYNIYTSEAMQKRSGYPLRPEFIESLMYLYRATEDPLFLQIGAELVDVIEKQSKTKCGYATVQNVQSHELEDRMESFFLAETTKYLYLLFDPDNFIHNAGLEGHVIDTPSGKCVVNAGGYIFNTEAHPVDPSVIYCCDKRRQKHRQILADFENNIDLVGVLGLIDEDDIRPFELTVEDFDETFALTEQNYHNAAGSDPGNNNTDVEHDFDIESGESSLNGQTDFSATASGLNSQFAEASSSADSKVDDNLNEESFKMNKRQPAIFPDEDKLGFSEKDWSTLLSLEQQLSNLESSQASSNEDVDEIIDYCSRRDYFSGDSNLDALLNAVYGRSRLAEVDSSKMCRMGDDLMEDFHYSRTWPTADDADHACYREQFTVSNLSPRTFRNLSRQSEYHYQLMSCKARPFLASKSSGLGAVASADFLNSWLAHN